MKKILSLAVVAALGLLCPTLWAQTVAVGTGYIAFTAQSSEVFSLYVDGTPAGSVSYNGTQQVVTLTGLTAGVHDLTVRLIRPTDRVAHLAVDYQLQGLRYRVVYDETLGRLSLLNESQGTLPVVVTPTMPATPTTQVVVPPSIARHLASEEDVQDLVARLNKTTFEGDKLQLAKSFVKGKHVTTSQAVQIANTLRFQSKRLDFLLYAFDYCTDRENYYTAADVLTFNSNKQKLLKRIQAGGFRHRAPVPYGTRRR